MNAARLPTGALLAYAAPAVALQAMMVPLLLTLPPFYAQDAGLALATISLAFGIARAWEAVSDPVIGVLSDRTRGRSGRRIPWMVAGVPLAVFATWFLLHPPAGAGFGWLLGWLMAFYLGWTMVYIPYQSWGAELSTGFEERSRIAGFREAGSFTGYLLATLVPLVVLVVVQGIAAPTYGQTVQTIGLFFMVALPLGVAWCVRRVPRPSTVDHARAAWNEPLRLLVRNRPFARLLCAYLFDRLAMGVYFALFPFYLQYVLGLLHAFLLISVVIALASLVFVPVWVAAARRLGKHRSYVLANGVTAVGYLAFALVPEGAVGWLVAVYVVLGFGNSGTLVLPGSMTADAVDYDELRAGAAQAGAHMAFLVFVTKAGLAGGALGLAVAALVGFASAQGPHDADALAGLRTAIAVVPALLLVPAVALMWSYPLDARRHRIVRRRLEGRRRRGPDGPSDGAAHARGPLDPVPARR